MQLNFTGESVFTDDSSEDRVAHSRCQQRLVGIELQFEIGNRASDLQDVFKTGSASQMNITNFHSESSVGRGFPAFQVRVRECQPAKPPIVILTQCLPFVIEDSQEGIQV